MTEFEHSITFHHQHARQEQNEWAPMQKAFVINADVAVAFDNATPETAMHALKDR